MATRPYHMTRNRNGGNVSQKPGNLAESGSVKGQAQFIRSLPRAQQGGEQGGGEKTSRLIFSIPLLRGNQLECLN